MAMPKRKPGQNALADLRADVVKHSKDITALKARIVDAESRLAKAESPLVDYEKTILNLEARMAKAETALGTVAKSGAPADVEPVRGPEETVSDPEQQPETE